MSRASLYVCPLSVMFEKDVIFALIKRHLHGTEFYTTPFAHESTTL